MELQDKINDAAAYILSTVSLRPTVGMVLGSGLGDFADTLEDPVRIPYTQIPNFPVPTIAGHAGALVFGKKQGKDVVVLQGRIHYYEGLSQKEITLPIRVLAAIGVVLALDEKSVIFNIVAFAWAGFGATFGPLMLFSLFWKRFTYKGAVAGIVVGAVVDICWLAFLSSTGIYEIIPGFIIGLIAAVVVSLASPAPSAEVEALYDKAVAYED